MIVPKQPGFVGREESPDLRSGRTSICMRATDHTSRNELRQVISYHRRGCQGKSAMHPPLRTDGRSARREQQVRQCPSPEKQSHMGVRLDDLLQDIEQRLSTLSLGQRKASLEVGTVRRMTCLQVVSQPSRLCLVAQAPRAVRGAEKLNLILRVIEPRQVVVEGVDSVAGRSHLRASTVNRLTASRCLPSSALGSLRLSHSRPNAGGLTCSRPVAASPSLADGCFVATRFLV